MKCLPLNQNNDEVIKSVNSEMILNLFEEHKKNTNKIIHELTEENNRLLNELKSAYFFLDLLGKRTQNLIQEKQSPLIQVRFEDSHLYSTQNIKSQNNDFSSLSGYKFNEEEIIEKMKKKFEYLVDVFNNLEDIIKTERLRSKKKGQGIEKLRAKTIHLQNVNDSLNNSLMTNTKADYKSTLPKWVPDQLANSCKHCSVKFGLFNRKHHCRVCGEIFCKTCCNIFEKFKPFYSTQVRMCTNCHKELKK